MRYTTPLSPAEFSSALIWPLLYILQYTYAVYSILPQQKNRFKIQCISFFLFINTTLAGIWLILWQYERIYWCCILLLLKWIVLVTTYIFIGINYGKKGQSREFDQNNKLSTPAFWILQSPVSCLLAWVSLLTQINIFIVVLELGGGRSSDKYNYESAFLQCTTTLFTISLLLVQKDYLFSSIVAWGLFGIAVAHKKDQIIFGAACTTFTFVSTATIATIIYLITEYFHIEFPFWKSRVVNRNKV
jgi:hypothetical protein